MAKYVELSVEDLRTRVQFPPPPPIMKPQPFSVGVFSCLIAPVPAYSCGFLRASADCAGQPKWPFWAAFHSLLAIPRSDLAPWNWPEVRKGHNAGPYRSKGYTRTNQAVGLRHWLPKGTNCRQREARSPTGPFVQSAQTVSARRAWQWRLAPDQAVQDLPRRDLRHRLDRRRHRRSPNRLR